VDGDIILSCMYVGGLILGTPAHIHVHESMNRFPSLGQWPGDGVSLHVGTLLGSVEGAALLETERKTIRHTLREM